MTKLIPERPLQRMIREDRQEEREKRQLSDTTWEIGRRIAKYSTAQLQKAVLLKDHPGELGYIGKRALDELKNREGD